MSLPHSHRAWRLGELMAGWLAKLLGLESDLPPIPPPVGNFVTSGNASVDRASERVPLPQRRALARLIDQKKLTAMPLPGIAGSYTPERGMQIDPTLSDDEIAKTLTHEGTHALQPGGWLDQYLQRTAFEDALAGGKTGVEYLDRPREREAFAAEKDVKRR